MLTNTSLPQAKPIVKRQRKVTKATAPKVPYLLKRLERKDARPLEQRMLWA